MNNRQLTLAELEASRAHLAEHGYVVLPELLEPDDVQAIGHRVNEIFAEERQAPFEPQTEPAAGNDDSTAVDELADFLSSNYTVSRAELDRLIQRVMHTRAHELQTPWPVNIAEVNKLFLHLPTLFDEDRSQRIWNLPNKLDAAASLVEHPVILDLVRDTLGGDCVLSDCSATSVGPDTTGGAWHVDVPLGQLAEPLPDFPLTTQNVWMLDDFTANNGATRVVPGSHLSRRKPQWSGDAMEGEITLTAPAGSVAIWLSNTWHRSGPNMTDQPRRAILSYYCRSWIKPFSDFPAGIPAAKARSFSPTVRYLLGYSARGPVRG